MSSRGDFGSNYGSTGVSFHRSPTHRQNDKFNELCDNVSAKVFLMNRNIISIENLAKQSLGNDGIENKLHILSQQTNKIATEINNIFKEIGEYSYDQNYHNKNNQYSILQEKLRVEYEHSLSRYQNIQKVVSNKMKANIEEESTFKTTQDGSHENLMALEDDKTQLISETERQKDNEKFQIQQTKMEIEQTKEKERRLRQIEEDMLNVNEIFRDLALLVHEQGDAVDSIEHNIEHAVIHIDEANQKLVRAKAYQKSARKRLCCLALIALIIATFVILIIYFSVK